MLKDKSRQSSKPSKTLKTSNLILQRANKLRNLKLQFQVTFKGINLSRRSIQRNQINSSFKVNMPIDKTYHLKKGNSILIRSAKEEG